MLKSVANSLKTVPVRSFAKAIFAKNRQKQEVYTKIRTTQFDHLKATPMSQEEFAKKYCSSFEEFVSNNDDLIQKVGLSHQAAFKKMISVSYKNYLMHQNIVEPGRIF